MLLLEINCSFYFYFYFHFFSPWSSVTDPSALILSTCMCSSTHAASIHSSLGGRQALQIATDFCSMDGSESTDCRKMLQNPLLLFLIARIYGSAPGQLRLLCARQFSCLHLQQLLFRGVIYIKKKNFSLERQLHCTAVLFLQGREIASSHREQDCNLGCETPGL